MIKAFLMGESGTTFVSCFGKYKNPLRKHQAVPSLLTRIDYRMKKLQSVCVLGSENFAKIAAIVREAGGEYISMGEQSHFRLPNSIN
jgi:hypothetical protein